MAFFFNNVSFITLNGGKGHNVFKRNFPPKYATSQPHTMALGRRCWEVGNSGGSMQASSDTETPTSSWEVGNSGGSMQEKTDI